MSDRWRQLAGFALGIAVCCAAGADTLILNDGTRIAGEIKRTDSGYRVTAMDGTTLEVPSEKVKSIIVTGQTGPDPLAQQAGLASLRRSVEYSSDLKDIIQRYQRFIENSTDAKVIADAQQDLALWQQRQEQKMVKVGAEWVTPQQRDALAAQAMEKVEAAFHLLAQARVREADAVLQDALRADPKNVAAMYLQGVARYRTDQLPEARKSFEAVDSIIADHAPTLNNLGVILMRQNQSNGAVAYFDSAMIAAPVNKLILDNVAEALNVLTPEQKKQQAVAKLNRRFVEQDNLLQEHMARQGMYRWGSGWVNRETIDKLRKAEEELEAKKAQMQVEFDTAVARLNRIDLEIRSHQETMRQIELNSYYRTPEGRLIRLGLPPSYYDTQREVTRLEGEKAGLVSQIELLRGQAKRVEQQLPQPKYTGVQMIIGIEGAPMKLPDLPNMPPPSEPASREPASSEPPASGPVLIEPVQIPTAEPAVP